LSLGWHGNAVLVRKGIEVTGCEPVHLPTLEPRGAVCAELSLGGKSFRVVGMHLDISGLRRHHQVRSIVGHIAAQAGRLPAVLMGDVNDWTRNGRALREFGHGWRMIGLGKSFPARRPIATLDRIVVSEEWGVDACGIHRSALAAQASDHLPVWATLTL
jgi:endonuclease/exonuclease/phosphatase family metal-dependent hydrolase